MCSIWKLSTSGFYDWLKRPESRRSQRNRELGQKIEDVFFESHERVGSPKIARILNGEGVAVSRPKIARIMKEKGLRCITHKKYRVATTDSDHSHRIAENLLDRNFTQHAPSRAWVSDLTYIRTDQGWLYLTTIIDLFDRAVIGWSMSDNMTYEDTVKKAWAMAKMNRKIAPGMIFHSDRGVQYATDEFRQELEVCKVRQSMSRKGNCWDNAVAESFFKILKSEMVSHRHYFSHFQAKIEIGEFIEIWYNRKRIHSHLGYMSPYEFYMLNIKLVA